MTDHELFPTDPSMNEFSGGKSTGDTSLRGPHSWLNWQAQRLGNPARSTSRTQTPMISPIWEEFGVYSDAEIVGELSFGPYELLHAYPTNRPTAGDSRLSLVLRVRDHLSDPEPTTSLLEDQETTAYVGGDIGDQISSLLALATARRFRSGGVLRQCFEGDQLGHPNFAEHHPPQLGRPLRRQILPSIEDRASIIDSEHYLTAYANASSLDAVAVMRAARQYGDALWWADLDPRVSWIKLFGALEAAADRWDTTVHPDPVAQLRRRHRGLHNKLVKRNSDALPVVAKSLSRILGAESKMIDFIIEHLPKPPLTRPDVGRVDWPRMEDFLHVLYDHRSRDLHGGIPFPLPLCVPPFLDKNGIAMEHLPARSASSGGATWPAHRLPMYLHTFTYVTGEVLRRWWLGLDSEGSTPTT